MIPNSIIDLCNVIPIVFKNNLLGVWTFLILQQMTIKKIFSLNI